ncbi:MAG: glycosyltransferase [Sphingobacteriaceae bacterium]|nr:glycosyltransferase [Sphingobacteriaceae bacterium]
MMSTKGYLRASNLLFAKCRGEFITFQDADDHSDVNRLEKLVNFLQSNSSISCVGSNINKVDIEDKVYLTSDFPLEHSQIENLQFQKSKVVMTGSSLMIRKEVLAKLVAIICILTDWVLKMYIGIH